MNRGDFVNINRDYKYFGAIVCEASGNISFDNCTTHGTITSSVSGDVNGGGLLGNNSINYYKVSMVNCINNINIEGNHSGRSELGGMAGSLRMGSGPHAFENVINNGNITLAGMGSPTNACTGGIIGYCDHSSSNNGSPKISVRHAINYGSIVSAASNATNAYAGGITGCIDDYNRIQYENCANYGTVSAQANGSAYSGGIVGRVLWTQLLL